MEKERTEKRRKKGEEIRELRGGSSRKGKEERKFKEEKEKWRKSKQKTRKDDNGSSVNIIGPGY